MWTKVSKEVLDKAQYIVPLKKGELQVEYAKALVKIDKAIEYVKTMYIPQDVNSQRIELLQILEDKETDINVGEV